MKDFVFIISIFITTFSFAQKINIDSCRLNNKSLLNNHEAKYFNESFSKQNKEFDFAEKKIGFASGNFGAKVITKMDYFNNWRRAYYKAKSSVSNQLLILKPEEKSKYGGLDAIVVSWSKVHINEKNRNRILEKLKEK